MTSKSKANRAGSFLQKTWAGLWGSIVGGVAGGFVCAIAGLFAAIATGQFFGGVDTTGAEAILSILGIIAAGGGLGIFLGTPYTAFFGHIIVVLSRRNLEHQMWYVIGIGGIPSCIWFYNLGKIYGDKPAGNSGSGQAFTSVEETILWAIVGFIAGIVGTLVFINTRNSMLLGKPVTETTLQEPVRPTKYGE